MDIPPKEIINEQKIVAILRLKFVAIIEHPFVISTRPNKTLCSFVFKNESGIDINSITIKKNVIIVPTINMLLQEFSIISEKVGLALADWTKSLGSSFALIFL